MQGRLFRGVGCRASSVARDRPIVTLAIEVCPPVAIGLMAAKREAALGEVGVRIRAGHEPQSGSSAICVSDQGARSMPAAMAGVTFLPSVLWGRAKL